MEFSWDPRKHEINKRKHGIGFSTASFAFKDPYLITAIDLRYLSGNEERWYSIGLVENIVLYVAHTIGENDYGKEIIHIISARAATLREQRFYFAHR